MNIKGAESFSAEQKHTKRINKKDCFFCLKKTEEAVFCRKSCEFQFLCVLFSRAFALWRTFVRRRRQNHDFCILMTQPFSHIFTLIGQDICEVMIWTKSRIKRKKIHWKYPIKIRKSPKKQGNTPMAIERPISASMTCPIPLCLTAHIQKCSRYSKN